SLVNVVAATTAGLSGDEHFGDRAAGKAFDLLVLEEAELVTESEFLKIAGRARRWVLVGSCEPADSHSLSPQWEEGQQEARGAQRPGFRQPFFHRLWRPLHCDPSRLPYAWVWEQDRLCCHLRPVSADQRPLLECERVADFPDIELRILVLPRLQPLLAEVVFPPAMTIQQAKEYIFKELEELPVQTRSRSLHWVEDAERIVLQVAAGRPGEETTVALEPGVREVLIRSSVSPGPGEDVSSAPWHTCRLEFDRSTGWQRAQAEEWVRRYLGVRDLGRTLRLDAPQRM